MSQGSVESGLQAQKAQSKDFHPFSFPFSSASGPSLSADHSALRFADVC